MHISRDLAHKVLNGLQLIVSGTELHLSKQVIQSARELAQLVSANVESPQQEAARKKWEAEG